MTVALFFLLGIAYLGFAGYGLTGLLMADDRQRTFLVVLNGFCLTAAVFSETSLLFHSTSLAFIVTLVTAITLNLAFFFHTRGRRGAGQSGTERTVRARKVRWTRVAVTVLALGVVAFLTWSFFSSGWHSYWGSANEDIFDGLYGRDAYLSGNATEVGRFLDPLTRYQYSSLAFWSLLFQSYGGMNVFYLQGQLMLFLQVVGIYYLARVGFRFSHQDSLISAFVGTCSAFYISTFFTGHEGSLMYAAIIPFLLGSGLMALRLGNMGWREGLNLGLWLFVIFHTYMFPLGFTLIPFVFFALFSMIRRDPARRLEVRLWWNRVVAIPQGPREGLLRYLGLALGVLVLGAITYGGFDRIWVVLEPIRMRATTTYRAWGISQYKEMLLIYWGILPSSIPFGVIANPARLDIPAIMISGYIGAGLLIGSVLYGSRAILRRVSGSSIFLLFFLVSWIIMFIVMKYVVVDSYYLYKFFYTNYYMGAILLVAAGREAFHASRTPRSLASAWRKVIVVILGICWMGLNILYITLYNVDVYSRSYNRPGSKLTDVSPLGQYAQEGVYFNLAKFDLQNVLRYAFHSNGYVFPDAISQFYEFELEVVGVDDIVYHPPGSRTKVWENRTFKVYRSGRYDKLVLDTYYQGERYPDIYNNHEFRWVRDQVTLEVIDPSQEPHSLFACVEPGPGLSYRPFWLYAFLNGEVFDSTLVRGADCIRFAVPAMTRRVNQVKLLVKEKGRNFLPWEERYLNYRVALIGMSEEHYPGESLMILNAPADIVPKRSWETVSLSPNGWRDSTDLLLIGNHWNPVEHDHSLVLRWVENDAQLLVLRPTAESRYLMLTVEKGPALEGQVTMLQIFLNGSVIDSIKLGEKRQELVLLPAMNLEENVITLHLGHEGKPMGRDPRILDFRVLDARLSR